MKCDLCGNDINPDYSHRANWTSPGDVVQWCPRCGAKLEGDQRWLKKK